MIIPSPLRLGDIIYLLAPAGAVDSSYIDGAAARFASWGYRPEVGRHCRGEVGRYSGTTEDRLADLQEALLRPDVKAIFCCRGGYGGVHLLDRIDSSLIVDRPKWLIGYSDVTALHALWQQCSVASLHAPMARHLAEYNESDLAVGALKRLLAGNLPNYAVAPHPLNRRGACSGVLRGGNLAMLQSLRGTPLDVAAEGAILFVEDVGERPYQVERMFYNLKLGGVLAKLRGLVVGSFTECGSEEGEEEIYRMIAALTVEHDYPVCFRFPTGHTERNVPLISGAEVALDVELQSVELSF